MSEDYMGPVYNEDGKRVARHPGPRGAEHMSNGRSPLPHIRGYVHEDGRVLTRGPWGGTWRDAESGSVYSHQGRTSEVDSWLRSRGFRPIFTKRDFHARLRPGGGMILECRRCGTLEEFSTRDKPHTLASFHAKWFHGKEIRIPSYKEVQRMAAVHERRVREAREAEES